MPVPPPRDAQGRVVPHDHQDILNEHHVIRHTTRRDIVFDGQGGTRLGSGAFSESDTGGMSVDIEEWMIADGLTALHYVTEPTDGAVRISVVALRTLGFQVGWDPDGGHPHHGLVWGIGNGSKRKRRIANIAQTIKKAQGED
jgi:hypothetical protein